jgi:hypothetical protein
VIVPFRPPTFAEEPLDLQEGPSLCKHCGRLINPTKLKRRLYCSERCKQDARLVRRGQKRTSPPELPWLPEPFKPEPLSLEQLAKIYPKPPPPLSTRDRILRLTVIYMAAMIIFMLLFIWGMA